MFFDMFSVARVTFVVESFRNLFKNISEIMTNALIPKTHSKMFILKPKSPTEKSLLSNQEKANFGGEFLDPFIGCLSLGKRNLTEPIESQLVKTYFITKMNVD